MEELNSVIEWIKTIINWFWEVFYGLWINPEIPLILRVVLWSPTAGFIIIIIIRITKRKFRQYH